MHPGERVVFEGHPSWRSIISFYLRGLLIALGAVGIAVLVTAIGGEVNVAIVVLVAVVALACVVVAGLVVRITTTYTITNQRLHIRHGVLSKREQQTRLERVQNVNTVQSPVDRMMRVGKVEFDTAGSDDFEFAFIGVNNPSAVVASVDRAQREHEAAVYGGTTPAGTPVAPGSASSAPAAAPGAVDPTAPGGVDPTAPGADPAAPDPASGTPTAAPGDPGEAPGPAAPPARRPPSDGL